MSVQYTDKSNIYSTNHNNTIAKTSFLIEDILYINNNNNNQSVNKNNEKNVLVGDKIKTNNKLGPNEDFKKMFHNER